MFSNRKFSGIFLAIAAAVALAACGGSAHAEDVTFKATDGQVFGTKSIYQYEMYVNGGGYVKVDYLSGGSNVFLDGGSLSGRILQNQPQLVNVTGTNTYIDPTFAARVQCTSGTSIVAYPSSGVTVQVHDNCAMFTQIQQKAK